MSDQEYLETLFNDCKFTQKTRYLWLSGRFGRSIRFLDELTVAEKSLVIDQLKEIKKNQWEGEI